jgi:histidinol-phosphate aminotransferase
MNDRFAIKWLVRKDLEGFEPYETHYTPGVIRLDANENPHDFPPAVKEYIFSRVGPQLFGRYPDPMAGDLVSALARRFKTGVQNIMAGNGSDELILNIILAFGVGRRVIISSPTFSMYSIHAQVAGATPLAVQRGLNFEVDTGAIIEAAGGEPGVIFLCNPNNPTGNATKIADIEEIAGSVNSLLVVDEAYIEFGGESCISLLDKYPNLIVMRTFSKAFGLAGLRVGYLLAGPDVVRELMRVKQPFNINSFSQLAALSVLQFTDLFKTRIRQIIDDRGKLIQRMKELPGLTVYPSDANFIFFSTMRDGQEVYRLMLDRGVMIRCIDVPDRGKFLRVSVGTARENDIFIENLRSILGET